MFDTPLGNYMLFMAILIAALVVGGFWLVQRARDRTLREENRTLRAALARYPRY